MEVCRVKIEGPGLDVMRWKPKQKPEIRTYTQAADRACRFPHLDIVDPLSTEMLRPVSSVVHSGDGLSLWPSQVLNTTLFLQSRLDMASSLYPSSPSPSALLLDVYFIPYGIMGCPLTLSLPLSLSVLARSL